jgi:hypothetical protein
VRECGWATLCSRAGSSQKLKEFYMEKLRSLMYGVQGFRAGVRVWRGRVGVRASFCDFFHNAMSISRRAGGCFKDF